MRFPVHSSWSKSRSHQLHRSCLQAANCCQRGLMLRSASWTVSTHMNCFTLYLVLLKRSKMFCLPLKRSINRASFVWPIRFCHCHSSTKAANSSPLSVSSCVNSHDSSLFPPTGNFKGMCKQIDHFPEETDYEADPSEYFLREYIPLISHI